MFSDRVPSYTALYRWLSCFLSPVIFRDLIDMPATVDVTEKEVQVRFDRRAHLPIVLASGLLDTAVEVPWWNGMRLRLTD